VNLKLNQGSTYVTGFVKREFITQKLILRYVTRYEKTDHCDKW